MWRLLSLLACGALLAAQQPLEQAWDLAARGQRPQAIQILRSLIQNSPQNADARLLLGSLLMEDGKQTESLAQLSAAVDIRPRSAEAQNALGEAYARFGNEAAARAAFEKSVSLQPDYAIAQLNLGQAELALGDMRTATEHLDRAIQLLGHSDETADARYLRAQAYMAQGEPQEAAAQLAAAVSLRPGFAAAWSDLGQARKLLLDDSGALAAFEKAVAANPQDSVAQYRLGSELLRVGQPHPAVEHLRAAYHLDPKDQSTLNSLQIALRQDGKAEEANNVRRQLADLLRDKDRVNQNHLNAIKLNNQGAQMEKSGDLRDALAAYTRALELYPEHVGIRVNHAVALLRLGQWTRGLDELHEALLRTPQDTRIKAALQDALAQAPRNTLPDWAQQKQ